MQGKSLIKEFKDKEAPTIEFHPEKKKDNEELAEYLAIVYGEGCVAQDKLKQEWEENKKAYEAKSNSQQGNVDAAYSESGTPQVYCSSIVADKIEDVVAIQLSGRPTVYPIPHINKDYNYNQVLDAELEESPDVFVRNLWSFCFKDLQERRGMQEINIKLATDSRLFGFSVAKIYQSYDFETQDQDVFIDVLEPDSIVIDPEAKTFDKLRYIFHKTWKNPYELALEYPKFKEEILSCVGGNPAFYNKNMTYEEIERKKRMVCVVEAYLRDLTHDETYKETVASNGSVKTVVKHIYKYPTGRRVLFLESLKGVNILKDEPNPYKVFPFAIFVPKPLSWCLLGRIEATPLRSLQYADDYVFQQMLANVKKLGAGVLLVDKKGCKDIENIEMKVGEIIEVDNMGSVQFSVPKGIGIDTERVHSMILHAAREISGVEAVSEGKPAGSITSGIGISLLQESTNKKVRMSSDIYAEFLQRVWKQVADIMIDLYREGRNLRVSNTDGIPVTLPVDLYEVTDSVDVTVDSFTQLANDPVSMSNLALSLLQIKDENGVPIIDREVLSEWLKIPGLRDAMKRIIDSSKQKAQQDMQMQMMGNPQVSGQMAPQPNADMGAIGQMAPDNMMGGLEEASLGGVDTMSPEQLAAIFGD